MASTPWNFPGTVASVKNLGDNEWSTPDNVKIDDANNAGWTGSKFDLPSPGNPTPGDGPELRTTNYGFSVPHDAYITGIECKIEGKTDSNRIGELAYLTQLGTPINLGNSKIDDWTDMPIVAPQGIHIYGSSSDLWGAKLTPTIVNSTNFGWIYMLYDEVDPLQSTNNYIQMRIHYLPAGVMMMGSSF